MSRWSFIWISKMQIPGVSGAFTSSPEFTITSFVFSKPSMDIYFTEVPLLSCKGITVPAFIGLVRGNWSEWTPSTFAVEVFSNRNAYFFLNSAGDDLNSILSGILWSEEMLFKLRFHSM